jgi:REP element-mobilizing transposase RayT
MPWGLTRFQQSGQSHFVTFCCYHRRGLLTTDESCRIFESALERVRRSYRLCVYGYVVMPEHVHLLLSEPQQDTLADALKSLKQGVSRRLIGNLPLKPKPGLNGAPGDICGKRGTTISTFEITRSLWKAALYSSQSGQARIVRASGGLGVEQFLPLRNRL